MWEQIAANKRKSFILVFGAALLLAAESLLSRRLGPARDAPA